MRTQGNAVGGVPRSEARRQDERGQAVSVLVLIVIMAMFLTAGLVIDGGQKATAVSRAESVAAGAARAAGNAAATGAVRGTPDAGAASQAARQYLAASSGVTGTVSLGGGRVTVRTRSVASTIFLSAIGIDQVVGVGEAQADIIGSRQE
ncbi:MAG TPA: pilus assembly protein TadE [Propionibacteriaceae bacterium]|nr:pilus assembly protein TadE [Propionibacteriaceae bacterium]